MVLAADHPVGLAGGADQSTKLCGVEPVRTGSTPHRFGGCGQRQRLRFTRSWSSSSDEVMIFEFAWKPRWAMIRLVNSWPRSTLDISSEPAAKVPAVPVPAACMSTLPEAPVDRKCESPAFWSPAGFGKVARASLASSLLLPLEKVPVTVPSSPIEKERSEAAAAPSCSVAMAVEAPPYCVMPPLRAAWVRSIFSEPAALPFQGTVNDGPLVSWPAESKL